MAQSLEITASSAAKTNEEQLPLLQSPKQIHDQVLDALLRRPVISAVCVPRQRMLVHEEFEDLKLAVEERGGTVEWCVRWSLDGTHIILCTDKGL